MIVKSTEAERYIAHPPAALRVALVYGPDQGLVRERAERMARTVVPDLADAFQVCELDEAALSADNARLADEAAAISMLGGRRVVRVRGAGNGLAKLFEGFLDDPKGDALVVVEAGDLAKGSALRKVFEDAANAAAIPCYADSPRDLADVVKSGLKERNLAIAPDALEDAVSRLGSDRGVTRQELEKLALYAHGQSRVSLEDVRAVMGDESDARIEEACDAAGEGNLQKLDLALSRLWADDMSPIAVLRLAMAHFQKLALAKDAVEKGEPLDGALRRMRPPIHFLRAASFKAQVSRWNGGRLLDALDLLLDTEVLCKTTGVPAAAVCGRALFNVAAMSRMRN
ncbi:MAG: DNA polymerase III subunit delta [Alphaproteobacteria bacterium]|nr:DNA polymerase III subunit delta [Alphaproteobacteria bacterium]MDE2012894.1 DNA polymerase III subunit delta [Alphaproteobacteria bacterium]MDE2351705.1 DNA polymerase III subunit delta [Alphaproteobacteria bacterium]